MKIFDSVYDKMLYWYLLGMIVMDGILEDPEKKLGKKLF